jgi:hypothetical protein
VCERERERKKCGHRKVLDIQVMSKFCNKCVNRGNTELEGKDIMAKAT